MTASYRCPADHAHGPTTTCYGHGCRCDACRAANTAQSGTYRKLIAYGRYDSGLVDVAPVREHLAYLSANGIGAPRAAELSGVSPSVIRGILYGRSGSSNRKPSPPAARISRDSAAAILRVTPSLENLAPGATISGRGVRRRFQALIARGWSMNRLAHRLGMTIQQVEQLSRRETVTARTHRTIAALYDELWDQHPPIANYWEQGGYHRAVNRAAARRWVPPLGWDDIDNDPEPPPTARDDTIDEIAVELAIAGEDVRLNHAEKVEGLRRMHPLKWSNKLIADHLGCKERTVVRLRDELGLPGWDQNDVIDRKAA